MIIRAMITEQNRVVFWERILLTSIPFVADNQNRGVGGVGVFREPIMV
jgi:hypothetical protein